MCVGVLMCTWKSAEHVETGMSVAMSAAMCVHVMGRWIQARIVIFDELQGKLFVQMQCIDQVIVQGLLCFYLS